LEQLAWTPHERSLRLYRRNQRDQSADVLDARLAQAEQRVARHDGAHPGMSEELQQQTTVLVVINQMHPPDTLAHRTNSTRQVIVQILGQPLASFEHALRSLCGDRFNQLAVRVEQTRC